MRAGRVAAVYAAAAIVLTFPLALAPASQLGALQGPGDPYLNLWILGWGLRAWTTDPASVFTGRVFDANIFHPASGTLAYSDHFLLQALVLAPVYAASGSAVLCYNLLLIASIAASGLAMHVLVWSLTGSRLGAWTAGLAWACWPYRTAHLLHLQLQALYILPLALLVLHRVAAGRRWRDAIALGAVAALQLAASVYYGLMTAIVLAVASVVIALATGQWRRSALWSRLMVAAVLAALLSVPVVLPYVRAAREEGFARTLFDAAQHAASWQSYTQVSPVNLLYGRSGLLDPRLPEPGERDRTHVEHHLFPGVVLIGLAVAGAVANASSASRAIAWSGLALASVGGVLSLGPDGARGLYAALHEHVYGFHAVRAPARFAVIGVLGLCLLAALGMRRLAVSRPRAARLVLLLLCLEYVNAPLPLVEAPPASTPVGRWLAAEQTPGAVLYLPLSMDIDNTPFMVESLEHGRPIVNGYSGLRPPFYAALVDSLADLPSPDAFAALREADVRFIVSPEPIDGAGEPRSPLVERARVEGRIVYEVRWTAEAEEAVASVDGAMPMPPGPPPFAAGERLRFDVFWESGPVDVAAGSATLTVAADPRRGGQWVFEVLAETAGWMAPFFEARDRFLTTADRQLLPLEHVREIREGRRVLDRRYAYDRAARVVDTGAVALPLGHPHARDAITALYYVRTLPLATGRSFHVPLNEAGSRVILDVVVGGREPIAVEGAPVEAWRLQPRITRRMARRAPPAITLWVTADARRLPAEALVDAGFGRIRLRLVDAGGAGSVER